MKATYTRIGVFCVIVLGIVLLVATPAAHADGPGYTLDWWTVDNGGSTSSAGGGYALNGTIGQPDAGLWRGAGYTLAGGFWGGNAAFYKTNLPLVIR